MVASFRPPTPDFKRLFEINHFYVKGKANREKTFDAAACGDSAARKRTPKRNGGEALGWEVGRKLSPLRALVIALRTLVS